MVTTSACRLLHVADLTRSPRRLYWVLDPYQFSGQYDGQLDS